MADKKRKITVLGDTVDESLTPEEEHKLEAKIDEMMAPDPPLATAPPIDETTQGSPKTKKDKILVIHGGGGDDDKTPAEEASKTAPPLSKATAKRVKIAVTHFDDGGTPAEADTSEGDVVNVEVKSPPEPKKYRPPDGPIPFKRAEPDPAVEAASPAEAQNIEDAAIAEAFESKPESDVDDKLTSRTPHLRRSRVIIIVLVAVAVALLATLTLIPRFRVQAMNALHVRASMTVTVQDAATHKPLSGVQVSDGQSIATTDTNGRATLINLRLGNQSIVFQKEAYTNLIKNANIAWRDVALGVISLKSAGPQYAVVVTDYISGQPIAGASVEADSGRTVTNKEGRTSVTANSAAKVSIVAAGYMAAQATLPTGHGSPLTVELLPAEPDIYGAKINGRFNIYKVAADGQNPQLLLSGTGNETSDMTLVASGDGSRAVLVSSRDAQYDKAGYLLDTLTYIRVTGSGGAATVDHAQSIRIIGWFADSVVYTALKADASPTDPQRYSLFAYNTTTQKRTELDRAVNFNDVLAVGDSVYYATDSFVKVNPLTGAKQTVLNKNVTAILRSDYNTLMLATPNGYYAYHLGASSATPINTTYNSTGRLYVDSPDGQHSAWVDASTGKLMLYSKLTGHEVALAAPANLAYPLRWLNNSTIVYRTSTSALATDQALSINGGTSLKIATVVDAAAVALWR